MKSYANIPTIIVVVWLFESFPVATNAGSYYSSLTAVQKLAIQEQHVVQKLVDYRKKLSETLELIDYYLDDYSESMTSLISHIEGMQDRFDEFNNVPISKTGTNLQEIAEAISANPIMVFKLLRRFAIDLSGIQTDIDNTDHHLDVRAYLNMIASVMGFPTLNDVSGAAEGILRLQETYKLPTEKIKNGILLERKTGTKLLASDLMFIGKQAVNQNRYATGLEWLYSAYQRVIQGDDSLPLAIAKGHLLVAKTLHNEEFLKFRFSPANLFSNLVNSNYSNIPELFIEPALTEYPLGYKDDTIYDVHNFNALCRGEQLLSPEQFKDLRCWYSRNYSPFNLISPLKVEMHYQDPPIFQVYDLLSNGVINHIKRTAAPYMTRSTVQGSITNNRTVSDVRISSVAWLDDLNQRDSLLSRVPRIVKRATGLECESKRAAEDLQVSCYGSIGGHYWPHMDTLLNPGTIQTAASQAEFAIRGDRIATIMFYLSEVELGGGTAFPRLGVAAQAVKGSAIIWYNMKLTGERNTLTLHGGCPVLYGNKWVANKWIRLYDQIYTRKCGKNESE